MDRADEKRAFGAIVVAAGSGSRMGGETPKQYRLLGGRPVLRHSLDMFASHRAAGPLLLVVAESEIERARTLCADLPDIIIVAGGASRRESVANGLDRLASLPSPPDHVLIHDAARPGLGDDMIDRLLDALEHSEGAVPVLAVPDSAARVEGGLLAARIDRTGLARVQTPQAFRLPDIMRVHAQWPGAEEATDDAGMLMAMGGSVAAVEGDERLMKLTIPSDFERYEILARQAPERNAMPAFRIGKGYDVHRLVEGEELWLCGVRIEHSHGLAGHSDADVAIHALCDAIFGALADGDIGSHFPPSDEKWRGARSRLFLEHALETARARGYALANCDLTLICEAPKIGPHREAMRQALAEIMAVPPDRVSVKATTTEKLGFTGRSEGIAAEAVVLLNQG